METVNAPALNWNGTEEVLLCRAVARQSEKFVAALMQGDRGKSGQNHANLHLGMPRLVILNSEVNAHAA